MKTLRFFINISTVFLLVIFFSSFGATYTVKRGDNLEKIAKKFGVSVKALIRENNLKKPYIIRPGQKLKIPVRSTTTQKVCLIKHKVKRGESLIKIAKKYRVWVKDIKKINNLKSDRIYVGQVLCIKQGKKRNKKSTNKSFYIKKRKIVNRVLITYRVRKGDSLSKIAKKYNTTVSRLIKLNGLKEPYIIRPGQKLKVEKRVVTYVEEVVKKRTVPFGFIWPVDGKVIEKFVNNSQKRHLGIDIQTECSKPVKAAEDGVVIYAGDSIKAYGNIVIIKHAKRFNTVYGHLGKIAVKEKQAVKKGQTIGYTGKLNGNNECGLYFEIRKNAVPVDPLVFLKNQS